MGRLIPASPVRAARRRRRGGFSLLELMIALSLLALGLLALAAMQLHAMRGGASGRRATEATAIAQARMELLQRAPWTAVAPTAGWMPDVVAPSPGQSTDTYRLSWRISDTVPNWSRAIDVRVRWDEPNRPNRAVTISSARFNREGL